MKPRANSSAGNCVEQPPAAVAAVATVTDAGNSCNKLQHVAINPDNANSPWRQLHRRPVATNRKQCCIGRCVSPPAPASIGAMCRNGRPPACHWWHATAARTHCAHRYIRSASAGWGSAYVPDGIACSPGDTAKNKWPKNTEKRKTIQ